MIGENESWRAIRGHEGVYEVSDLGRVRSLGRYVPAKLGSRRWQYTRILSPGRTPDGHLTVSLRRDGRSRSIGIHRLVLLTFVGDQPPGMEGCHNNGDPSDNRRTNLRWDTPSANGIDAVNHGRNRNSNKTRCVNGHELTEQNIYRYGRKRACKPCILKRGADRHAARKAS